MKKQILTGLAMAILLGGWLAPAWAQHYPPSPSPPFPNQQTIEEQNEFFRMQYMTDEEEIEYRRLLRRAETKAEREGIARDMDRRMRQRAEEHGFRFYPETVPGYPPTATTPDSMWECFYNDCWKEKPVFPIIDP